MTAPAPRSKRHPELALTLPRTAAALARYRFRAWLLCAGGALAGMAAPVCAVAGWQAAFSAAFGGALVLLALGLTALCMARLMRRELRTGPWRAYAAETVPHGVHAATVVLAERDNSGRVELWPMKVWATRWRYLLAVPEAPDGVLWFCGDPARGGVAALPGGDELVWFAPVVDGAARLRAVREATVKGLVERPRPDRPRGQKQGPDAYGRKWGPGASWRGEPGNGATAGRGAGLFRWLLVPAVLMGVGAGGVAAYADAEWNRAWDAQQTENDPQVELQVLHRAYTGSCWARWTDPWTGRPGTRAYDCGPDPDPLTHDWVTTGTTGRLVAEGDHRGTMYYLRDGELVGYPYPEPDVAVADTVSDLLAAGGVLLGGAALAGGSVRHVRRRLRR
jgi:hypothetical protein